MERSNTVDLMIDKFLSLNTKKKKELLRFIFDSSEGMEDLITECMSYKPLSIPDKNIKEGSMIYLEHQNVWFRKSLDLDYYTIHDLVFDDCIKVKCTKINPFNKFVGVEYMTKESIVCEIFVSSYYIKEHSKLSI